MNEKPANYFVDIDNNIIKPTDFIYHDGECVDDIADKIMKFKKPFWRIYGAGRFFEEEYVEGAISSSYITPKMPGLCDWLVMRYEPVSDDFYKNEGEDDDDVKLRVIEYIKNECLCSYAECSWYLVYYFPNGEDPNDEKNEKVLVCKFQKKD